MLDLVSVVIAYLCPMRSPMRPDAVISHTLKKYAMRGTTACKIKQKRRNSSKHGVIPAGEKFHRCFGGNLVLPDGEKTENRSEFGKVRVKNRVEPLSGHGICQKADTV